MSTTLSKSNLDKLTRTDPALKTPNKPFSQIDQTSVAQSKFSEKRLPLSVKESWKEKESLRNMIATAHANR